jgi:predicted nucleotidyltransferase
MASPSIAVDREQVLATLRSQRQHVERLYGLRMVGIVGSVARGDAQADSDIDVMVDVVSTPTLFQVAAAEEELSRAIGAGLPVEFVFREDLRPGVRAAIERDFVPL